MKDVMQTIYPTSLTPEQYAEAGISQASPGRRKTVPIASGRTALEGAGLLPALHHHRHRAGLADLGAAFFVPALSGQRELPAGLCAAVSAGQHADDRGRLSTAKPRVPRCALECAHSRVTGVVLRRTCRCCCGRWATPLVRCRSSPRPRASGGNCSGSCGDLARATRQLIHQFHTCLFGTYRCHQRRQLQAA